MLCRALAVRCGLVGALATAVLWAARTAPTMHRSGDPQQMCTTANIELKHFKPSMPHRPCRQGSQQLITTHELCLRAQEESWREHRSKGQDPNTCCRLMLRH